MKKPKNYKPQKRRRLKPTVGKLEFRDVCYLDRVKDDAGVYHIKGYCTCKKWESSAEANTITKVGLEAKAHVQASGGKCALRPHDDEIDDATRADIAAERELVEKIDAELKSRDENVD